MGWLNTIVNHRLESFKANWPSWFSIYVDTMNAHVKAFWQGMHGLHPHMLLMSSPCVDPCMHHINIMKDHMGIYMISMIKSLSLATCLKQSNISLIRQSRVIKIKHFGSLLLEFMKKSICLLRMSLTFLPLKMFFLIVKMNSKVWYLPYFEGVYHTRMWMHVWYVWFILWLEHYDYWNN